MKKNLTLTIVLFIFNASFLVSQFSVKIVNENFNSNMLRWDVKNDEFSNMELSNGKYTLACNKEGTAITSTIEVPHLQFTNYRISTSISKLKGIDDNGFGLVWGGKDENNELEFVISGNGQFKIMKWEQGIKTDIVVWNYSSAINKWDFSKNDLKIESLENVLRFYINGIYVAATKDMPHMGTRAGFVLNEKMQVEIDQLIIENLSAALAYTKGDINNIEVNELSFSGNKSFNEIYYNETGNIMVELINESSQPVKDITLYIQLSEPNPGLLFNPITMVDQIAGNEKKIIEIPLTANEEVPSQNNSFTLSIKDVENHVVASKNISIKTVGLSTYYTNNETKIENTTTNPTYNNKKSTNNSSDACAKGCSGLGLLSLLTALIIAIL